MAAEQSGWLLGVDFGTSNTAAAHVHESSGAVQALALSHNGNLMPSSLYVESPAVIDVGDVALNKAAGNPAGFVAAPKRLLTLGQDVFQVGEWDVPGHAVVGAVLRSVLGRAVAQHGGRGPGGLVLTHPEGWSAQQVRVLIEAAGGVGFGGGSVHTVSEPRAAAHYYARSGGVGVGDRVAVFDFGGGTLDIAVLAAGGDGSFEVVAAQGDNALGGRNFDAAIRRWVDGQLADRDQGLLEALQAETSVRELWAVEESIRSAKEVLSEASQATINVSVGGRHEVLSLTRSEFEGLIERDLGRAVDVAAATFAAAGVDGGGVRSIYLTGGSSRIPLVHQRVSELGAIATLDDPKTVVAQGALIAVRGGGSGRSDGVGGSSGSQVRAAGWSAHDAMRQSGMASGPLQHHGMPGSPMPQAGMGQGAMQQAGMQQGGMVQGSPMQQGGMVQGSPMQQGGMGGWQPTPPGIARPHQLAPGQSYHPGSPVQAGKSGGSRAGWIIGAVIVLVAVIGTTALIALNKNNKSDNTTTTTSAATSSPSTKPVAADVGSVVSNFPGTLRDVSDCKKTATSSSIDGGVRVSCSIKAHDATIAGLFKYDSLSQSFIAHMDTDPSKTAELWRKYNGDKIAKDTSSVIVKIHDYVANYFNVEYLNLSSGLTIEISGFSTKGNAETFLSRVGL